MAFLNPHKCPNCGSNVSKQANFCPSCGTRLEGGTRRCGACGTENRGDARFCKSCGQPLEQSATADVHQHRWTRGEGDFAIRLEADDLPGLLKRGVKVEPGTNAMFIERGANQGFLPPGEYTLGTLGQRLKDWVTGDISERVTVLLVDLVPTEMTFHLGGRFTKDPLPIGMSVRLLVEVAEPGKFLINMLRGRERLTIEEVRRYLYPEVVQVADRWLREHTLEQLAEDPTQQQKFELALEEELANTFAQTGLRFLQARTVELNLEPYDHVRGVQGKYALQIAETRADSEGRLSLFDVETGSKISQQEAELKAKKRFGEIQKELDLQGLADETRKVEMEERKVDLYARMRQAVLSDKMNEVRSEAEFEQFLEEVGFDKKQFEKERNEFLRTWREEAEDHEKARAHLLAKLEVERNYELRSAELKLRSDLSEKEMESELRLARLRATRQEEIEAARWEFTLRRRREEMQFQQEQAEARLRQEELERKAGLGMEAAGHDEEIRQMDAELELGLKGLRGIKQARLEAEQGQWEIERQKREFEWQKQQQQLEMELQRERIQMDHELNRLDKLGQLGTEALISASGAEQARILSDLKKTEALKGMTEEQILAAAAKDSPEVARALQEKFQAIAEGESSKEVTELYERLLAEREVSVQRAQEDADRRARELGEAWDKASLRAQETSERALDRMSDTAQAFARGQGSTPIVITSSPGGSQVVQPGSGEAAEQQPAGTKVCTNCGRFVPSDARHCEHCGHKFEGM